MNTCTDTLFKCYYSSDMAAGVVTTVTCQGEPLADPTYLCRKQYGPSCRYSSASAGWNPKPVCSAWGVEVPCSGSSREGEITETIRNA